MVKRYVVTITREFGSMGRPIAKRTAELLGIEYYDRDIVEETAKRMNMPLSSVSREEERAKRPFFGMKYPLGMGTTDVQDNIFIAQQKIINQLVERGPCIVVGRCSDYILKNMENAFHVYIYASYENKMKNCVELLGMKEKEAIKMIHDVDKARAQYHKHYAGYAMDDPKYKDLMINSHLLGVDGTSELLVDIVKRKFIDDSKEE